MLGHINLLTSQTGKIEETSILKSAYLVLLYNIVESTIYSTMEHIHENLAKHNYSELSEPIQKIYIEYYFEKFSSKKHKEHIDGTILKSLLFPEIDEYTKRVTLFSGNLDASSIRDLLGKYGIGRLGKTGGMELLVVKSKRNKLAHGEETFTSSCRGFTTGELEKITKSTCSFLDSVISLAQSYLSNKRYLRTQPAT